MILITSRRLYYVSFIATVLVLVVSFTHIGLAVIAFERGDAQWTSWFAAGGSELFMSLTGFGLGEIIKYRASQAIAKYQHAQSIFPGWMLGVMIVGLSFFALWVLWGNFYYTSVVAVNENLKEIFLKDVKNKGKVYAWVTSIKWEQLKNVDGFHLFNSYMAALALPIMAFMGTILNTIFDLAATRTESNGSRGNAGVPRKRKSIKASDEQKDEIKNAPTAKASKVIEPKNEKSKRQYAKKDKLRLPRELPEEMGPNMVR